MILRIFAGLVVLLLLLAGLGAAWQAVLETREAERFPPPGVMVEVDGLNLHLDCRGQGSPTVILEAGLTSGTPGWRRVHDAMAEDTRVCGWDRPGMGWSEPSYEVVSSEDNARRLRSLLTAARIEGPHILLGMSAGGVFVREYYAMYPDEVRGMVLVDSSHEQQASRMPEFPDAGFETLLRFCAWTQPLGVIRLAGIGEGFVDRYELSEEERAVALAGFNRSHTCASVLAESNGFDEEIDDARAPRPLGDLPLIVLSQGKEMDVDESGGMTVELATAIRAAWTELQLELTSLSSRGERRVAHRSGHVIQMEQPEAVIEAVRDMVEIVRSES